MEFFRNWKDAAGGVPLPEIDVTNLEYNLSIIISSRVSDAFRIESYEPFLGLSLFLLREMGVIEAGGHGKYTSVTSWL